MFTSSWRPVTVPHIAVRYYQSDIRKLATAILEHNEYLWLGRDYETKTEADALLRNIASGSRKAFPEGFTAYSISEATRTILNYVSSHTYGEECEGRKRMHDPRAIREKAQEMLAHTDLFLVEGWSDEARAEAVRILNQIASGIVIPWPEGKDVIEPTLLADAIYHYVCDNLACEWQS